MVGKVRTVDMAIGLPWAAQRHHDLLAIHISHIHSQCHMVNPWHHLVVMERSTGSSLRWSRHTLTRRMETLVFSQAASGCSSSH